MNELNSEQLKKETKKTLRGAVKDFAKFLIDHLDHENASDIVDLTVDYLKRKDI